MADPISMTAIAATAIGGGVTAYGQYFGSQAQSAQYKYQSAVAQMNAQIAQQNAKWAMDVGEIKAQQEGFKTAQQIAQTKAAQGASNLAVNVGSQVDVRASEADLGRYSEKLIRSDAARQAYGFEAQAAGDIAQSHLDEMAAKNAKTAGYIQAAGTLLGTAGSVSSKWISFSQQGVPGFGDPTAASSTKLYGD